MFAHDLEKENAYHFSRLDSTHLLSTVSPHPLELDGETWPSAEHYFEAQLARTPARAEAIKQAANAERAYRLGNIWWQRKCEGWKQKRRVMMTRALYTKVQMYPVVREELMATGDRLILETSAYDHYWGIGRDQRGENMLGKVWMDIRAKLRQNP